MKKTILSVSTSKAALAVGIAFITSVVFVTIVDDFLLANFVVPGDTKQLASDIAANSQHFGFAVVGYLLVLVLDAIIGLALYVILKPANKNRALLTSVFRLLYTFILMVAVFALAFQIIDAFGYASIKLVGYILFAIHIFILGYAVLRSAYIPKSLGVVLMLASVTYITFFVDLELPEALLTVIMLTMAIAELALSIWLLIKRNKLPLNN